MKRNNILVGIGSLLIGMMLVAACGPEGEAETAPEPKQSVLAYCTQAYAEFNDRHPEYGEPELTPEEQCASGIEEGIYSTPAEVDALLKAFE